MRTLAFCAVLGLFMGRTQALKLQTSLESELQYEEYDCEGTTHADRAKYIIEEVILGHLDFAMKHYKPGETVGMDLCDHWYSFTLKEIPVWTSQYLDEEIEYSEKDD